jgi:hypothetical protein
MIKFSLSLSLSQGKDMHAKNSHNINNFVTEVYRTKHTEAETTNFMEKTCQRMRASHVEEHAQDDRH